MIGWAGAERLAAGLVDGLDVPARARWPLDPCRGKSQGGGRKGMTIEKLAVIGGGAWGTALAQVAATGGRETMLWAFEDDVVAAVNKIHENPVYLKGVKLEPAIRATSNFSDLKAADAWLVVTPAQHMRAVLGRSPCPKMPLILCSKGIEESSGKLLHEVAHEVCPTSPVAVLSGPTFAHEVAAGLPTAVTLACEDKELGQALRRSASTCRPSAPISPTMWRGRSRRRRQECARDRLRRRRGPRAWVRTHALH